MTGQTVAVRSATLPALVRQAAERLARAETAAEVLEAREMAGLVADEAQRRARLLKARNARDEVFAATYHAKADALEIEAAAERRLAEEYTQAQARGETAKSGQHRAVPDGNSRATTADLGLSRKHIREGRLMSKAEQADPGIVARTAHAQAARGEEPSRAEIKRAVKAAVNAETAPADLGHGAATEKRPAGRPMMLPQGTPPGVLVRAGLAREGSETSEAIAKSLGLSIQSYRQIRYAVLLAERDDLTAADLTLAQDALAEIDATRRLARPMARLRPLIARVFGGGTTHTPARAEAVRLEKFERIMGLLSICGGLDSVDVPYLQARRKRSTCRELRDYARGLRDFAKRVEES